MSAPHVQAWAKVNARVDIGALGIVQALNSIPNLETVESCQGPPIWVCFKYGAYWEHPWRDLAEFVLDDLAPAIAQEIGSGANVRIQVTGSGFTFGELRIEAACAKRTEFVIRNLARQISARRSRS